VTILNTETKFKNRGNNTLCRITIKISGNNSSDIPQMINEGRGLKSQIKHTRESFVLIFRTCVDLTAVS
jgi:hypothetical protein